MNEHDRISPWVPMTDATAVKALGKCAEECSELATALIRCVIQGIDEPEPETGKLNRDWVEDEVADVLANLRIIREHFTFDEEKIGRRAERKYHGLKRWHAMQAHNPDDAQ